MKIDLSPLDHSKVYNIGSVVSLDGTATTALLP